MGNLFTQASAYLREHKEYRRWVALFLCLALVISTATTALLTRPGVAMTHTERVLSCPFEGEAAHTHTEDCYQDGVLVCTLPERELHTHTEDCYTTEKTLICEEEESDGHVHTEDCYSLVRGELICTDESEDHVHTDDCYAWESVLSCGMEEGEGAHHHTDACYTETKILTCGQEELLTEHVHGPGCFTEIVVEDEEPEATETPAATEAPAETPAPTEEPEATETPAADEVESDPEADLEYYWMWTEFFSQVTLTGDWNEDLVTVARTQLGYTESARNFTVDEDGRHGYTRYGEWYGLPHGDWCAMFVSFCLNFSDIPREAMPWESVTTRWVKNLTERGMFAMAESGYVPKTGDLVFFTDPEYRERVASHVGIVAEVTDEYIISIEGNNGPTVAEFKYELDDEHIYGYGILPEEPEPEETAAESGLALITAADGTALPEDAQPHAYTLSGPDAEAAQSAVEAWLTAPEGPQMLQTRRASARMAAAERNAAEDEVLSETKYQVFEIGLDNVEASEYEDGFLVRVTLPEALTGRDFTLFHLGDDGVEELTAEYNGIYNDNGTETVTGFSFVTDSFSPFVLRYTVDFHYTAEDGKTYDFSMPGGGFLTLPELVQALHLTQEGEEQAFASAVESITFSDPSLLWVGRADENTTVGALKASLNLNSAYSADLTASDIAALNETAVSAGEWLLISLHPFDSLETLTITMRDGREISVDVTDARIVAYYLNDRGELYEVGVTYGDDAQIPDGATLKITEYAQDSAEYLKARGDVLADLEKNEVSVDPDSFGLAALDISILDAEGNEIEPAAPVQVDMSIKALPGVENLEAIAETLVVNHHVETETGVEVQTVYGEITDSLLLNFGSDSESRVSAEPVSLSFSVPGFSTFTVNWRNNNSNHTTIHYGYMDGDTFVEFPGDAPQANLSANADEVFLLRDISGYQYAGRTYYSTGETTHPKTGTTEIPPHLTWVARTNNQSAHWEVRSYTSWDQYNTVVRSVANGSHIYVTYEPKPEPADGGTLVLHPVNGDDGEPPANPDVLKSSSPNPDGTNTLALSVRGPRKNVEYEKLADVIVVVDVSGSMSENMTGGTATNTDPSRISILKNILNGTDGLVDTLLNLNRPEAPQKIRLGLVSFSTTAQVEFNLNEATDDIAATKQAYKDAVTGLTTGGATNWEGALKLANEMAVGSDRDTYVIFITDGNPTVRYTRTAITDQNLQPSLGGSGDQAREVFRQLYDQYGIFGNGSADYFGYDYDCAVEQGKSIVETGKNFYAVAIAPNVDKMQGLIDDSGGVKAYMATNAAQFSNQMTEIVSNILVTTGWSSFTITDGITDLSQIVKKSDLVSTDPAFDSDSFTYYKGRVDHDATQADVDAGRAQKVGDPVVLDTAWQSWNPADENCAPAVYNDETGAVEWHMGDKFMPQDGFVYQVRFKVWPSQEAYDLLADLNNGVLNYDEQPQEIKDQIAEPSSPGGSYTLKTNSNTSYTYRPATIAGGSVRPTGDPSEPGSFDDVDPLYLEPKPLKIKKIWKHNYVDSRVVPTAIDMELYGVDPGGALHSDKSFRTIELEEANGWSDEHNYVSYGLVTLDKDHPDSDSTKIYETGHDFTLRELGENAHYYELSAGIYRPMVINGKSTVLQLVDKPAGMSDTAFYYKDGEQEYYRLDGKVYWDTKSDIILIATNSHRSYMDLTKELVPNPADPDPTFEYEIKITVPDGIYNYDNMERYLWFSVYDPVQRKTLTPGTEYEYTNAHHPADLPSSAGDFSGPDYADYLIAYSGDTFTLKIKPGWNVRFLNLPNGTTYEFKEVNIPGTYEFRSADVSGTVWDDDSNAAVNLPAPLPSNDGSSPSNTVLTGTIELANARYKATYHNGPYTPRKNISVTKQWSDGTHSGDTITFTLYQRAIAEVGGAVIREQPYPSGYTNTITGSQTVTIEGLPSMGTVDGQKVTFDYYVVETGGVSGYTPVVTKTSTANPTNPTSVDGYTILNVAPDALDEPTSVTFTKEWKGPNGGDPTLNHDSDQIQVKLIQKAVDSGYVPVTVRLINGNGSQYGDDQVYFVSKGSTVTFTATKPEYERNHRVTITSSGHATGTGTYNSPTGYGSSASSYSVSYGNVTGELTIVARLSNRSYYGTRYDSWGSRTDSEYYYGDYYYVWVASVASTGTMLTSVDDVIEAEKNKDPIQTQSYLYTLTKDDLTDGPFTKTMSGDWIGNVSDLPLFKKIDDSTFYAYYYSIEEVSVNGEMIRPGGGAAGQTDEYTVAVVYDPVDDRWKITNTEKEKVSVSITKAWLNANGTTTAPANASVVFELYRDDIATGKTVTLDGTADTESDAYESASWVATWKNLPKEHDDGTPYNYTVQEVSRYDGYEPVYGPITLTGNVITGTITNEQQLKSFSFSKAWIPLNSTINSVALDALEDWGADRTISVALHRVDPDTSEDLVICSYVLGGAGTFLPTDSTLSAEQKEAYKLTALSTGKLVTFTMGRGLLPENASGHPYTYYVVETDATGGIYNTYYGERNSGAVVWTSGLQKAFDGQVILNHQMGGYALPATGGIGTLGYQLGGLALIGAALAGLLLRKVRRRAKGGDLTA